MKDYDYQAKYFATVFENYSALLKFFRFTGGHLPSKLEFLAAKSAIKKAANSAE